MKNKVIFYSSAVYLLLCAVVLVAAIFKAIQGEPMGGWGITMPMIIVTFVALWGAAETFENHFGDW